MQKKKILIVNYNMIIGGSTTSLINFVRELNKEKYEIDILLYRNEGPLLKYLPKSVNLLPQACMYNENKKVVKIFKAMSRGYIIRSRIVNKRLGVSGFSSQIMSECQAKEYSRKLDKQYDVAIGYMEGWADRYVAYRVNAEQKYGWLHSTFNKIAPVPYYEMSWMQMMDKVVCVAESCRIDMIKQLPAIKNKSITIENMVDQAFVSQRAKEIECSDSCYTTFYQYTGFKIVSVCRLSIETKGIDRIINCVEVLKSKKYDFLWMIVGDGTDKNEISKKIKERNLENYLVLTGGRSNPYPIMAQADIVCMPSRWEGKPMTVLEAKALGIPCLVTRYLSASEQINDGKDGWIVDNTNDSIIPAIEKIINNKQLIIDAKKYLEDNPFSNKEYVRKIESTLFENY